MHHIKAKSVMSVIFLYTVSEMSKPKKLVDAAITYLNSEGKAKMSVKKLQNCRCWLWNFYNHFDSIEDIQFEALSKTVKDMLIDFKLNVINEKDYVYIIYLALLRALNLLSNLLR